MSFTMSSASKNLRKAKSVTVSAGEGSVKKSFPIVGIGASAGGLEAFTQLLNHLPGDTGMAFVLVQHLSPDHPSQLASLLAGATPTQDNAFKLTLVERTLAAVMAQARA